MCNLTNFKDALRKWSPTQNITGELWRLMTYRIHLQHEHDDICNCIFFFSLQYANTRSKRNNKFRIH